MEELSLGQNISISGAPVPLSASVSLPPVLSKMMEVRNSRLAIIFLDKKNDFKHEQFNVQKFRGHFTFAGAESEA